MTDKKICVYAICKNEIKHLDKWLENMSEADYVVVLDTGSTDGSYEFLKNDPRCTRAEQKIIDPWRFDVARNESMKLIPEDAEIFVCTDPDELFNPGWCKVLRENWRDEATRAQYLYAWNHNEIGEPMNVFYYDKIHTKGYHWIFPVHEVLWSDEGEFENEVRIDFKDKIFLHHWQDLSVQRKNYLDLLKLSVKENPNNPHVRHLYAREYILQNNPEEAYKTFFEVLNINAVWSNQMFRQVLLDTMLMLASLSWQKDCSAEALYWCNQFLRIDDTYREPYLLAIDIYNSRGQFPEGKAVIDLMNQKCHQHFSWVEKHANWLITDKLMIANNLFGFKQYAEALKYYDMVLKHEPNNINALKAKVACLEILSKQ